MRGRIAKPRRSCSNQERTARGLLAFFARLDCRFFQNNMRAHSTAPSIGFCARATTEISQPNHAQSTHKQNQKEADHAPVGHHRAVPHVKTLRQQRQVAHSIAIDHQREFNQQRQSCGYPAKPVRRRRGRILRTQRPAPQRQPAPSSHIRQRKQSDTADASTARLSPRPAARARPRCRRSGKARPKAAAILPPSPATKCFSSAVKVLRPAR